MLKDAYSRFFAANGNALHAAAHSHHPWPDVTREAQLAYWEDSVRLTNEKWEKIFGEVVPEAQTHVARWIGWPAPQRIAFAPNTHEFVMRLYSCLDWSRPVRVLTTANEFTSFARQTRRLEETGRVLVSRIPVEPFATFAERFRDALTLGYDLVFLSHVFYDSGFLVEDLDALLTDTPEQTIVAVDGYHAVGAVPVDAAGLAKRIFYLGGGYKYLQAGEGACYMALPENADALRPVATGWFANFRGLAGEEGEEVGYGPDAMRFWGATFDASALYRLNAVMRLYAARGVDGFAIREHVVRLMERFLERLDASSPELMRVGTLVPPIGVPRGNFVAFEPERATEVEWRLLARRILVDRRGNRVRFGFGVYHDLEFVDRLVDRMMEAFAK
ncbi:MAG: aminotransferase class V-fold PLP-dependent enzyme [Burkholderiales bacterium]|nr:aminotransferase class V-fold PLP-dependent enzyme [Burkholderiales bacterium]